MNNMKRDPSLFVGNLSMFINEEDIEALFGQYSSESKSITAKIMKTELGVSRGYGFIKMLNEDDAENAMINLHGKQFHGRPLKVKWSERNARKDDPISISENDRKNSVHVKFSSTNREYLVTEETILHHFSRCGNVVDVSVKQSGFTNLNGLHRGYAFVYFEENASGKDSAIRATTEVTGDSLVLLECQPSHNLIKQLDINNLLKKNGKTTGENRVDHTDNSIKTTISYMPQLQIDRTVLHSHTTAAFSSSQQKNGNRHIPPQLLYPNPHPSHVTPYIPEPNHFVNSPRYMLADNQLNQNMHQHYSRNPSQHSNGNIPQHYLRQPDQFMNDNMQQQYLRQQYEQQQHYQMNCQLGYPPRYYVANQSTVPIQRRPGPLSGPIPFAMPMSIPSSMPIPLPRYTNEYPYPHQQLRQQAPYIAYSPHPQVRASTSYNPNLRFEQSQRYRVSESPQQVYSSSSPSLYIPQLSSSNVQVSSNIQQTSSNQIQQLPPNQVLEGRDRGESMGSMGSINQGQGQ